MEYPSLGPPAKKGAEKKKTYRNRTKNDPRHGRRGKVKGCRRGEERKRGGRKRLLLRGGIIKKRNRIGAGESFSFMDQEGEGIRGKGGGRGPRREIEDPFKYELIFLGNLTKKKLTKRRGAPNQNPGESKKRMVRF